MRWLKTISSEIFGLFVDDGSFALAILVWLALVGFVLLRLAMPMAWGGIILFAGLALILLESAMRRARRG
jgi:hypothetical protein